MMRCHISQQALSEGINLFYYNPIISQTCLCVAFSLSLYSFCNQLKAKSTSGHLLPVSMCCTKSVWHCYHEVVMATFGCQRMEHPRTPYNLLTCDCNTTVNYDWICCPAKIMQTGISNIPITNSLISNCARSKSAANVFADDYLGSVKGVVVVGITHSCFVGDISQCQFHSFYVNAWN